MEFKKEIKKARKRVERMDKIEGFKDRYISTILSALEAGLSVDDSTSAFEAYVMLEDLVIYQDLIQMIIQRLNKEGIKKNETQKLDTSNKMD